MFVTSPSTNQTNNIVNPRLPTYRSAAVTPADGSDLPNGTAIGLRVTGAGNVNVQLAGGGTAVLTGLSAGQTVEVNVSRVLSTSTTATGILALYGA